MMPDKKTIAVGYDFSTDHPRARFLKETATFCRDAVDIEMNPGNRRFPGADTIDAVRSGDLDFGWINFAHLERIAPSLAAIHAPFTLSDATMHTSEQRSRYLAEVNSNLAGTDLCVAAVMRGADQVICTKREIDTSGARFAGLTLRGPGPGVSENIITARGAKPSLASIVSALALVESGEAQGAFTSPGAWATLFKDHFPHVYHIPGLMMINYVMILRSANVDTVQAKAVSFASMQCVTEKWEDMRIQDEEILSAIAGFEGCTFEVIEPTDSEVGSLTDS
jgi:C4-dicarboxylate-binding protein DctP